MSRYSKRMSGIKTDWKDEILANAELGTLERPTMVLYRSKISET